MTITVFHKRKVNVTPEIPISFITFSDFDFLLLTSQAVPKAPSPIFRIFSYCSIIYNQIFETTHILCKHQALVKGRGYRFKVYN